MKMAFAPSEHAHDQLDGGVGDDDEAFRPISFLFFCGAREPRSRREGRVALGEQQAQHANVDNQKADGAVHA